MPRNGKLPSVTCYGRSVSRNNHRCRLRTARDHKCWIHSQREDGLRVMRSHVAGLGLFAVRPFKKDEEICRYTGKIRNRAWVNARPDSKLQYIMSVSRDRHIDATHPTSCYGRFINSVYRTGMRANTRFVNPRSANQDYIRVVAKQNIRPNTELLVNYGGAGGYYAPT